MGFKGTVKQAMEIILDDTPIWQEVNRFNYPNIHGNFVSDLPYKQYKVSYWNETQEKIVNGIFINLSEKDLFALDWQHDCFIYNPRENIPLYTWWEDQSRNCNVYFPSYYPNGDFHAFVSMDYTYGIYGHPWREEIYVVGLSLIELFEKNKLDLGLMCL
ncbi:MAG: DUF2716 domain-containing protein [Alistipes sp.]|nr:DUF2716 domain-containing protein [Alistipes sp.]